MWVYTFMKNQDIFCTSVYYSYIEWFKNGYSRTTKMATCDPVKWANVTIIHDLVDVYQPVNFERDGIND